MTRFGIYVLLALTALSCKPRSKSRVASVSGGACVESVKSEEQITLERGIDLSLRQSFKREISAMDRDAKTNDVVREMARGDQGKAKALFAAAAQYGQMVATDVAMPIMVRYIKGTQPSYADLISIQAMGVRPGYAKVWLEIVATQLRPYVSCLEGAGAQFDTNGRLNLMNFRQNKVTPATAACVATGFGMFVSPQVSHAFAKTDRDEAIFVGDQVIPVCKDNAVLTRPQWEAEVAKWLNMFNKEAATYLSASGAKQKYSELMRGSVWKIPGLQSLDQWMTGGGNDDLANQTTEASYNNMLKMVDVLKCLGAPAELRMKLRGIMSALLEIDSKNIDVGLSKVAMAEKAAIAAPFVPLVIYTAPAFGAMVSPGLGVTLAASGAAAKMALIPIVFSLGSSVISSTVDTAFTGSNWWCNMGENIAVDGAASLSIAPFMAAIPSATSLVGAGAGWVTGSSCLGTKVYGASNIALAVGFLGKAGGQGVNAVLDCRETLDGAMKLAEAAETENDLIVLNQRIATATKQCLQGGIDISFAFVGTMRLLDAAKKPLGQCLAGDCVPEDREALQKVLENQKVQQDAFAKAENQFGPSVFKELPKGLPENYRSGYQAIMEFLNNKARVFKQMQALEYDVQEMSRVQKITPEEALTKIMVQWEQEGGFKPAIDLAAKTYNKAEWLEMLRGGALFNDTQFADTNRMGARHALLTHRLQWHALMREMRMSPQLFNPQLRPVDYYTEMGNPQTAAALDWSQTGVTKITKAHLWFHLFDSFDMNYTSPEFFRGHHSFWPGTGNWN